MPHSESSLTRTCSSTSESRTKAWPPAHQGCPLLAKRCDSCFSTFWRRNPLIFELRSFGIDLPFRGDSGEAVGMIPILEIEEWDDQPSTAQSSAGFFPSCQWPLHPSQACLYEPLLWAWHSECSPQSISTHFCKSLLDSLLSGPPAAPEVAEAPLWYGKLHLWSRLASFCPCFGAFSRPCLGDALAPSGAWAIHLWICQGSRTRSIKPCGTWSCKAT